MADLSIHPAALPPDELWAQVKSVRRKAGGPGGQRRNKVETGIRLIHGPTGLTAEASERRASEDNRRVALGRLRRTLALQVRLPVDLDAHQPSPLWVQRTGGARLSVNDRHPDVPALVAEALDVLAACADDLAAAAAVLGVTPSRLVKVLRLEPAALSALNRRLADAGKRTWS